MGPGFGGFGPPPPGLPAQVMVLGEYELCGTLQLDEADETELLEGDRDPSGLDGVDERAATLGEELS